MEQTRFQFRNSMTIEQLKAVEKAKFNIVPANEEGRLAFWCGNTIGAVSEKAVAALEEGDVTNLMVAEALDTSKPKEEQKWVPILYVAGGIRSRKVLYEL